MSNNLTVHSRFGAYHVTFIDSLAAGLLPTLKASDVIILDSALPLLHESRLGPVLEGRTVITVEASETAKSFEQIGDMLEQVVRSGFRKGNRLVAIGGGVTQDVCAFMATTLFRGVEWIFVPTTLLAQGDSCIGGKSSINFRGFKNLLGSFLPPRAILVDSAFLSSLPDSQIASGIGEIMHFLVFQDEESFRFLETHIDSLRGDPDRLRELTSRSLSIKKAVVERDELDQGERQLFNYGHSFGHALEAATSYRVPHGIAVSIGMDVANYVSVGLGLAEEAFRTRVRAVASKLWSGYSVCDIDMEAYFAALRRDKKNVGSDVYVILARGFGGLFKSTIDLEGHAGDLIRRYFQSEAP